MIIAINGLPNSGKDTVGRIIQYLNRDKAICNFFYNVTTLEEGLKKIHNSNIEITWQVKKFSKLPNKLYKKKQRRICTNLSSFVKVQRLRLFTMGLIILKLL